MENNTYDLLEKLYQKLNAEKEKHIAIRDALNPEDSFTEYGYHCGFVAGLLFALKDILFEQGDIIIEKIERREN